MAQEEEGGNGGSRRKRLCLEWQVIADSSFFLTRDRFVDANDENWRSWTQGSSERPDPVPSPVIDMDNSSEVKKLPIFSADFYEHNLSKIHPYFSRLWQRLRVYMQKDWCQTWSWLLGNRSCLRTGSYYVPLQKSFRYSYLCLTTINFDWYSYIVFGHELWILIER